MASIKVTGPALQELKVLHKRFAAAMGLEWFECPFEDFVLTLLCDGMDDMKTALDVKDAAEAEGYTVAGALNVH